MSKYNYSSLKEISSNKEAYFYGIISDATFPCLDDQENVYVCILKIIDHTVNHLTNPFEIESNQIYLTIKSDLIENLPYIHHIGDIIRVHRGTFVQKLKKNVYCNLETKGPMKSHWCIFSGASDLNSKSFEPVSCSSRTFTLETFDYHIISNLRVWVSKYLKEKGSLVYSKTVKLIDRNREVNEQKDLIVQVCSKKQNINDTISLWIQDSSDGCELVVYNIYNYISPGQIIRIRSFKTYEKNIIVLNNFSNILIIPSFSNLFFNFTSGLIGKFYKNKLSKIDSSSTLSETKVISSFKNSRLNIPQRSIDNITFNDNKFWMKVSIISIGNDIVSYFDSNANKNYDDQKKAGKNSNAYFNTYVLVVDDENSSSAMKLYLSTFDGEGEGLFGNIKDYLSKESKAFDGLKKFLDKKNSVELLVEAVKVGESDERIYRIIGNYS